MEEVTWDKVKFHLLGMHEPCQGGSKNNPDPRIFCQCFFMSSFIPTIFTK